MINLCEIMEFVTEQKNILHLDIKPENIMVTRYGKELVLIDFGRSKRITIADRFVISNCTAIDYSKKETQEKQYQYGALGYAAPECFGSATESSTFPFKLYKGIHGKMSIESDIFSLGATFWECLNIFELATKTNISNFDIYDFYRNNFLNDSVYCNRDLSLTTNTYHLKLEKIIKKCTRTRSNDFTTSDKYYHSYRELKRDIELVKNSVPTIIKEENIKVRTSFKLCGVFIALALVFLIINSIFHLQAYKIAENKWDNYNVILDPDAKFSILSYNPPQTVVPDKEYIGVTQGTLKAPDGFLISNNNNNGWKESITVPLKETTEGLIKYYIRNNNSTDIEYFNAISDVKKYNYTCVQTIPKVKKITFEKDNNNSLLKFLSFDIISNENIIVTVYVEGGFIPLDTNIYLGNDDNYECSCVKAENAVINDEGRYTYTASFKYEVNKGESISKNLKAYAEYCSYTLKSEEQNKFLMIDKRDPVVVINNIDGNYDSDNDGKKDSIKVDFSVSDADSGIKTVKYKWDDGFKLNADDNKYQTDYKTFDNYSDNQTDYSIILPWNCAKPVENNRHEIEIVATDMTGNQSKDNRSDGIGSDILPPNIKSVSIKQNES